MQKIPRTERALFAFSLISAALFWAGLAWLLKLAADRYLPVIGLERAGTAHLVGAALLLGILSYIGHWLATARRAAWLRGYAIEISAKQFPDLYTRIVAVCKRLDIEQPPVAYLAQHPRLHSTDSLHYQGRDWVVLNSDLVNAFTERQGAVEFLVGYELGRIHDRLRPWSVFLWPANVLPLLGPALLRARIYRYDHWGIAGCHTKVDAAFALAIAASGEQRWKSLNIPQFASQTTDTRRFWTALFELIYPAPWLTKRMAHLRAIATNSDSFIPRRHLLAYVAAALIPLLRPHPLPWLRDAALVLLWIGLAVFWGLLGYQQATQLGLFGLTPKSEPTSATPAPVRIAPATPDSEVPRSPYVHLHADLRTLGGLALARFQKHGGNPCEIGNIHLLRLSYQSNRYAFSCDEPIVYTLIGRGEFEPGKPAHLHSYNWKTDTIITGPAQ